MKLNQGFPGLNLIDLESGEEIRPDPAHGLVCFFMVEHIRDAGRIRKITGPFLQAGCRRFCLFGQQEAVWYSALDEAGLPDDPDAGDETAVLKRGYATQESFLEDIRKTLEDGSEDVYMLYDDREDLPGILFGLLFGDPVYPDSE